MEFFNKDKVGPVVGFEDYWKKIEELGILPEGALKQLPESLGDTVRAELMKRTPEESAQAILVAIDQVNHGSVAPVEELVLEILKR